MNDKIIYPNPYIFKSYWGIPNFIFQSSPHQNLYIDGEMSFQAIEKSHRKSAVRALACLALVKTLLIK